MIYETWVDENWDELAKHFKENYLPHNNSYEAWTFGEIKRFHAFCEMEYWMVAA